MVSGEDTDLPSRKAHTQKNPAHTGKTDRQSPKKPPKIKILEKRPPLTVITVRPAIDLMKRTAHIRPRIHKTRPIATAITLHHRSTPQQTHSLKPEIIRSRAKRHKNLLIKHPPVKRLRRIKHTPHTLRLKPHRRLTPILSQPPVHKRQPQTTISSNLHHTATRSHNRTRTNKMPVHKSRNKIEIIQNIIIHRNHRSPRKITQRRQQLRIRPDITHKPDFKPPPLKQPQRTRNPARPLELMPKIEHNTVRPHRLLHNRLHRKSHTVDTLPESRKRHDKLLSAATLRSNPRIRTVKKILNQKRRNMIFFD